MLHMRTIADVVAWLLDRANEKESAADIALGAKDHHQYEFLKNKAADLRREAKEIDPEQESPAWER